MFDYPPPILQLVDSGACSITLCNNFPGCRTYFNRHLGSLATHIIVGSTFYENDVQKSIANPQVKCITVVICFNYQEAQ